MYLLRRISTHGGNPMVIQVDQPDGKDGGFQGGGVFYFAPAGEDGSEQQVSEHAAQVIMGDAGLAPHFTCDPPLPAAEPEPDGTEAAVSGRKRSRRGSGADQG